MEITSTPIAGPKAAAKKPVVTLESLAGSRDPEKVKKDKEAQATLQSVLSTVKSGKTDWAAQRKAAAMEKVARIKQSIQALKMSGIIDPKMVARIAARLAKELAAAVKEYTSAGGSSADIGATPNVTTNSSASKEAAPSSNTEPVAADAPVDAQVTAQPIVKEDAPIETKATKGAVAYETQQKTNGVSQKSNASDQDDAFKKSVQDAIKELRKLIDQNKFLVTNDKDKDNFEAAEKALRRAEQSLASLGGVMTATPVSVSV